MTTNLTTVGRGLVKRKVNLVLAVAIVIVTPFATPPYWTIAGTAAAAFNLWRAFFEGWSG
jgi:hypothetical protein